MYVKRKMFVDIVIFFKCIYIEPCSRRLVMRQKHLCDFSDPYDNFKIRALKLMSFEGVLPFNLYSTENHRAGVSLTGRTFCTEPYRGW